MEQKGYQPKETPKNKTGDASSTNRPIKNEEVERKPPPPKR